MEKHRLLTMESVKIHNMVHKRDTLGSRRGEVMRFSTQRTTPSFVRIPIAVDPNCRSETKKTYNNSTRSIVAHGWDYGGWGAGERARGVHKGGIEKCTIISSYRYMMSTYRRKWGKYFYLYCRSCGES